MNHIRVLWLTNLPLSEAQEHLFNTKQVKEGWLVQLSRHLAMVSEVELHIASHTPGLKKECSFTLNRIVHHCYPHDYTKNYDTMANYWKKLYDEILPDIVHIQGTEGIHSFVFVKTLPFVKTIVSIQGLVSVCQRYYYGGLQSRELSKHATILQFLLKDRLEDKYKRFVENGNREVDLLKNVKAVIGRTQWDRCHAMSINPQLQYYSCGEVMRPLFYKNNWSEDKCERHTIFVTQGLVPYKGFHQAIKALPLIKQCFPDVKLKVALLPNVINKLSLKERFIGGEYMYYLRELVKSLGVEECIHVLGPLSEQGMVDQMLNCNVFLSPSAIENSPNSVCEAQLLGVPVIASNVGGTEDVLYYGDGTGLYRYEEYEVLAQKIIHLFTDGADVAKIQKAHEVSVRTHNAEKIVRQTLEIYKQMLQ